MKKGYRDNCSLTNRGCFVQKKQNMKFLSNGYDQVN